MHNILSILGSVITGVILVCLLFLVFPSPACADTHVLPDDLSVLSLEELMDITVTSISKRPETLQNTAAAVFVITSEDIRRSGVTSIPEALRMVPGLQVARNTTGAWSISCRGRNFNAAFENKMLVLIDGRSAYSPLFGGTYWNEIDMVLEDIERIEVVRGPGNSVWGANAISGVVNIITRDTRETQGGLASVGGGTLDRYIGQVRYGGSVGDRGGYRIYAKVRKRDYFKPDSDAEDADWGDQLVSGFRSDLDISSSTKLSLHGDMLYAKGGDLLNHVDPVTGTLSTEEETADKWTGSLMAHLDRDLSEGGRFSTQISYDHTDRGNSVFGERRDIWDLDVNHIFTPFSGHRAQWGLGGRVSYVQLDSGKTYDAEDHSDTDSMLSGFVQDEIRFAEGRWRLTLGSKAEYREFYGLEFMPSTRLLYTPNPRHSFWGAVSRSVRMPTLVEQEVEALAGVEQYVVQTPLGPQTVPVSILMQGNRDLDPETIIAYELGYRFFPSSDFSVDSTLFFNELKNVIGISTTPVSQAQLLATRSYSIIAQNLKSGQSYGFESSVDWKPATRLRLQGSYSLFRTRMTTISGYDDVFGDAAEYAAPAHQLSVRSWLDLPHDLELDCWFRFVDDLYSGDVPRYATMDLRLGWKPKENFEFSVVGQNLFEPDHAEMQADLLGFNINNVERAFYAQASIRF